MPSFDALGIRTVLNLGEQGVLWHVFLVFLEVGPIDLDRVPSEICAVEGACLHPRRCLENGRPKYPRK